MNKICILVLALGLVMGSCKSGKRYTDKLRTKNVLAARKDTGKVRTIENSEKKPVEPKEIFTPYRIESIPEYIETFSWIAQQEMRAYGIPASITLAQGLLESGYGKGELALKTNNHFGIKCHSGWEGDFDFHDDDEKGECFRKYNHPKYSYRDHSLFLTTRSRYDFLFSYASTDYKNWAKGLRTAGYATDKKYPQKLIYIIEKYNLHKFDEAVKTANFRNNTIALADNKSVHIVSKGDTLYSISKKYFVSIDELMQMNNLQDSSLQIGQKLTIKYSKINR